MYFYVRNEILNYYNVMEEIQMMTFFQKLGRSLMLPVAVLPAAAVLMGIGHYIGATSWGEGAMLTTLLITGGNAIILNIPILFAVGVALGMSKDEDGSAALSGLVAWLVITTILDVETVALFKSIDVSAVNLAFTEVENVFVGIISGLTAAFIYNRFSQVQLPDALSFFSGRRLVPILTAVSMLLIAVVLFFVWPIVYNSLVSFGTMISELGYVGAGLFGFFNRILIPTGLHHALNQVFWFDIAGINDIGNFWAGVGEKGVTGMYQAGFYPIMMFGLPAAALAMYHTAKTKYRKETASLMFAAGFAAFFTGVTEPLEFSFIFLAPGLFFIHAILTGLSLAIAAFFSWTAGFTFSAGFIDYSLSFILPLANKPYMLIVQGIVFGVIYYFVFKFVILKFDLKTPGRDEKVESTEAKVEQEVLEGNPLSEKAGLIYQGLGNTTNIKSLQHCATRIRVEINDMSKVDLDLIKTAGVIGVQAIGDSNIQIIVGPQVQFLTEELNKLVKPIL